VDVLFVGPSDLSAALGCPGQLDAEVYIDALNRVVAAARGARIAAGILVGDTDMVEAHLDRGFSFVAVASDSALLRRSATTAARKKNTPSVKGVGDFENSDEQPYGSILRTNASAPPARTSRPIDR